MQKPKHLLMALAGIFAGLFAGVFGAGGGIAAMPFLSKAGLAEQQKHAASVFIILAVTAVGAVVAAWREPSGLRLCLPFLAGTVCGGIGAAILLKKLPPRAIRISFGLLLCTSAVVLALR